MTQMVSKPAMIKDEYTEKYYEEDNFHNKDLFNPNKAAANASSKKLPRIAANS